jgi:hypothetical protein
MQFTENIQANWQEGYCFFMTVPDSIQPEQPKREFENYSKKFLNICLTAWTWPTMTSICLVCKCFTGDEEVESSKRGVEDLCALGFDTLVKCWDKCINVDGGHGEK